MKIFRIIFRRKKLQRRQYLPAHQAMQARAKQLGKAELRDRV